MLRGLVSMMPGMLTKLPVLAKLQGVKLRDLTPESLSEIAALVGIPLVVSQLELAAFVDLMDNHDVNQLADLVNNPEMVKLAIVWFQKNQAKKAEPTLNQGEPFVFNLQALTAQDL